MNWEGIYQSRGDVVCEGSDPVAKQISTYQWRNAAQQAWGTQQAQEGLPITKRVPTAGPLGESDLAKVARRVGAARCVLREA